MSEVSELLRKHYEVTFEQHGPTSAGVDWGTDSAKLELRYDKMLAVILSESELRGKATILDVGCGYGGLLEHALRKGMTLEYTGIDVCANMIEYAHRVHKDARFLVGDILKIDCAGPFDYVVCNGILTQKLTATQKEMDQFAHAIVRRMFALSRRGIAFNVMTTNANFFASNLYYRSPVELLSWAISELTTRVALDHSYPLYEFTLYLYKEPS
jgi:SAM-dependent methyltransferase